MVVRSASPMPAGCVRAIADLPARPKLLTKSNLLFGGTDMRTKRLKVGGFSAVSTAEASHPVSRPVAIQRKLRKSMSRNGASCNEYSCAIEKTQNGKYNVRFRVAFAPGSQPEAGPWTLKLYFLASSFNGAMKKLEAAL